MRKITLIMALVAFCTLSANAQVRVGVTGGLVIDNLKAESNDNGYDFKAKNGFEVGLVMNSDLGSGFAFQPALLYSQKSSELDVSVVNLSYTMNNIEVPLNFQWGYQMDPAMNLRPFIQFGPYASYALKRSVTAGVLGFETEIDLTESEYDGMKKFDYGLSVGAGLDIWKVQVMFRYNWGMANVFDLNLQDIDKDWKNVDLATGNFNGFAISAAILF